MQSHSLNNLPQLDLIQTLNCQNDISNLDPDLNIPSQCNFKYYTTDQFRNDDIIKNCISVNHLSFLHNNIRSLNANFDNFVQMLSELSCSFSVIGLTETRLNDRLESTFNYHLDSYSFVSQRSLSNAGGVGFYVKDIVVMMSGMIFLTLWQDLKPFGLKFKVIIIRILFVGYFIGTPTVILMHS